MIGSQQIDYIAKKALAKGLLVGAAIVSVYLLIVVLTTPNLPPSASIYSAFMANSIVIGGTATAVGAQIFFSSYGKSSGCRPSWKVTGIGPSGSTLGSFFSFFSLIPLGCCGSWLFVLSFLPSIFGGALSVFLIEYSKPLSYVAVATALGIVAFSGIRLRSRIKGKS